MAVTRDIQKVELTYQGGQIAYVRIFETLSIPNPAVPSQIITDDNMIPVGVGELTGGEISDLDDALGGDFYPIANRLNPITP